MPGPIAPGVFHIEIPVPFRFGHVNLFLIDTGEVILVDTGVATAEAFEQLKEGLNRAPTKAMTRGTSSRPSGCSR